MNELSHFYFTPKPIVDESSAKVLATQRALPAVEMEDVTPFHTTSQADKAAPQEVKKESYLNDELIPNFVNLLLDLGEEARQEDYSLKQ